MNEQERKDETPAPVDEPQRAALFHDEESSKWDRGDKVSTEDLRIALKRYRSFFDRLLSV